MLSIIVYKPNGGSAALQLNPGTKLTTESIMPAFDDKLENGIYSFPIEVPWTDHNKLLLGFVENLASHNNSIPDYWRCDVIPDGATVYYDAKFKMVSHKGRFDGKQGSYSFIITGVKGLFGSLIKGKKLTDLRLEGVIKWDAADDSRGFAYKVMSNQDPANFSKLNFAPIAALDYIDSARSDFNAEFIAQDVINNVLIDNSYTNGWTFGREKPGSPNIALTSGTALYENYRTIPFLNLFWVIKQIFIEHGFTASGEFFNYPNFNLIHIFNIVSIEFYDYPFPFDLNRQITPNRHLPKMFISDFLVAIQNAFNLRIDWLDGKRVEFNFKSSLLVSKRIKNFTHKCISIYDQATRHEAYEGGIKIEYNWDPSDAYPSDFVKDTKDINIIDTVDVYGDIASLALPAAIDNTTYIYVRAENYYYNFIASSGRWEPAIEQFEEYTIGKEEVSFSTDVSPLCHHYQVDPFGFTNRMNMVAVRQTGSYYNDSKVFIENDFTLRLFYIKQINSSSLTNMPISFCHNYDSNGNKLVETSLSFKAADGLYNKLWRTWIEMLINSWNVQAKFILDVIDIKELDKTDILINLNNQYLVKKTITSFPLTGESEIELVKI